MITTRNIVLLALMLLSAVLGAALRPTISLADERPPIDLAAMVPKAFGDWREETSVIAQVVNPQQKGVIDKIYSQTLSRTYKNGQGYRVMLSIAYGKDQSDALSLHKPELCYPAQGFMLLNKGSVEIDVAGKSIAATSLATSMGQRFEPVTYWIVIGDHVATDGNRKKLIEIYYALHNRVPDGMLVRVSSIDNRTDNAYALQRQFVAAMIPAIASPYRTRVSGVNRQIEWFH